MSHCAKLLKVWIYKALFKYDSIVVNLNTLHLTPAPVRELSNWSTNHLNSLQNSNTPKMTAV